MKNKIAIHQNELLEYGEGMADEQNDFELFCKNKIFSGLAEKELRALYTISKEILLLEGTSLIREGEQADELFIIIDGTLEVSKYDPAEKGTYVIDILNPGDTVGEISFIDRGFRSATVRAKTNAQVRSISFKALEDIVSKSPEYSNIYIYLSKNITQKLRNTNTTVVEALKLEIRENKTRVTMGLFLVNIITALCLFAYGLNGLKYLVDVVPNTSYIAFPLTLAMGIFLIFMMKVSNLSWRQFGITLINWKQAIFEGIFFPAPILALAVIFKLAFLRFDPEYAGHSVFEPYSVILDPAEHTWAYWILLNLLYWFIMIPIQELLTRGGLQGLLEHFLTGKHSILMSIVISNLIFSTVHVFFGLHIGILVFIAGLYIGWIYSRTHNLISSCIAHAIIGTWGLSILGLFIIK